MSYAIVQAETQGQVSEIRGLFEAELSGLRGADRAPEGRLGLASVGGVVVGCVALAPVRFGRVRVQAPLGASGFPRTPPPAARGALPPAAAMI